MPKPDVQAARPPFPHGPAQGALPGYILGTRLKPEPRAQRRRLLILGFSLFAPPIFADLSSSLPEAQESQTRRIHRVGFLRVGPPPPAWAEGFRTAILALAVPAMSVEQAEEWATRAPADRVVRAIRDHDVWVAVDGSASGWVEVDRDRVAALYVSPSCARRGVGSILLARAETSIRSSGYATACLESSQNALDFYLRRATSGAARQMPRE